MGPADEDRAMTADPAVALELRGVAVVRAGRRILDSVDWTVRAGERWAVLGPNGSGKTTLVRVAGLWLRPTAGAVSVAGERSGRTDIRTLRGRIGFTSCRTHCAPRSTPSTW
jgi:iron complex transport system ATP-binding protein